MASWITAYTVLVCRPDVAAEITVYLRSGALAAAVAHAQKALEGAPDGTSARVFDSDNSGDPILTWCKVEGREEYT